MLPPGAPLLLALASLLAVNAAWLHYLWLIPKEKVPARPTGHLLAFATASLVATAAVVTGALAHTWLTPALLAAPALGLAAFFLYLLRQAPLPDTQLTVAVGSPLPLIEATAHDGGPRSTRDLAGQRLLIKFFRGSW
ncbi:MAG: hypothetical protein R3B70_01120 [Polyangiaceae bacterium]